MTVAVSQSRKGYNAYLTMIEDVLDLPACRRFSVDPWIILGR